MCAQGLDGRRAFVDKMGELRLEKGSVMMRQGDRGCNFFIIRDGACSVTNSDGNDVRSLSAGASFGELSLITGEARTANVFVSSETASVLIAGKKLMSSSGLLQAMSDKRADWIPFLRKHAPRIVETLDSYALVMLVDAITPHTYVEGDVLSTAGEQTLGCFCIVKEGCIGEEESNEEMLPGASLDEASIPAPLDHTPISRVCCVSTL